MLFHCFAYFYKVEKLAMNKIQVSKYNQNKAYDSNSFDTGLDGYNWHF